MIKVHLGYPKGYYEGKGGQGSGYSGFGLIGLGPRAAGLGNVSVLAFDGPGVGGFLRQRTTPWTPKNIKT